MTTRVDYEMPAPWSSEAHQNALASAPRKLHGVQFPVVPTGPWMTQMLGVIAVLCGVFMIWGFAVALIVGGVGTVVVSMLNEAGMLKSREAGKV